MDVYKHKPQYMHASVGKSAHNIIIIILLLLWFIVLKYGPNGYVLYSLLVQVFHNDAHTHTYVHKHNMHARTLTLPSGDIINIKPLVAKKVVLRAEHFTWTWRPTTVTSLPRTLDARIEHFCRIKYFWTRKKYINSTKEDGGFREHAWKQFCDRFPAFRVRLAGRFLPKARGENVYTCGFIFFFFYYLCGVSCAYFEHHSKPDVRNTPTGRNPASWTGSKFKGLCLDYRRGAYSVCRKLRRIPVRYARTRRTREISRERGNTSFSLYTRPTPTLIETKFVWSADGVVHYALANVEQIFGDGRARAWCVCTVLLRFCLCDNNNNTLLLIIVRIIIVHAGR